MSSRESLVMITKDNERYKCILPQDELPNEVIVPKLENIQLASLEVATDLSVIKLIIDENENFEE